MLFDKNSELYNIVVYVLFGLCGFLVTLVGVIYNSIKKTIDKLVNKVEGNSEEISAINARCEERGKKP